MIIQSITAIIGEIFNIYGQNKERSNMRTETIKIFKFEELSKEAQRKAIEQHKEWKNQDYWMLDLWHDCIKEELKEKGWHDVELQYSLSCCQGDGLSFSGVLDIKYFLDNIYSKNLSNYKKWAINEYIYTVHSEGNKGHYCYASKSDIDYIENYQDGIQRNRIDNLWQDILEEIKEYYYSLCKEYEKQGYNEIDYQLSDECIIRDIQANEYEFLKNGVIHN